MLLQVAGCDMYNKSALDCCPAGGSCLPFLQQHVRTLEQHASGIARQLLQEECKLVAGLADDMPAQATMHRKAHPEGAVAGCHAALMGVSLPACLLHGDICCCCVVLQHCCCRMHNSDSRRFGVVPSLQALWPSWLLCRGAVCL